MPSFLGSSFSLESVTQIAPATVRVRFTQDPKATAASASNDALNPANYTLTGSAAATVASCGVVVGDTQSIDLFLAAVLPTGTWALAVAGTVVAYDGVTAISAPTSLTFQVTLTSGEPPLNQGAENDDAEAVLRKHLNPALKGPAWDAIVAAIATGEQKNWDNAKSAFDQLFKSSASGVYLERLAADDGLTKPQDIGMSDELFRQYAVRSTNGKLVESALLDILEVFYGSDAVRASADTGVAQPYGIQDGDVLTLLLDEETTVNVVFANADFAVPGKASAAEVAAAITRALRLAGEQAYALAATDPQLGTTKVRVYSGSLGLGSSVRITGGRAQNALQFPTSVAALTGLPSWTVTFIPATGRVRFAATTGFDASQLLVGDYVNLYGTEFNAANRGTWTVVNVYWTAASQYFEVSNGFGVSEAVTQLAASDLTFFRPTKQTVHSAQNRRVVVASIGNEVDVVLPATSSAVTRGKNIAAYAQANAAIAVSSLERVNGVVTVTTASAHGMSVGSQVFIDGVYGSPSIPPTTLGTNRAPGAGILGGTSDYSQASIWSNTQGSATSTAKIHAAAVKLNDGRALCVGGDNAASPAVASNVAQLFRINSRTVQASGKIVVDYDSLTAANLTAARSWGGLSVILSTSTVKPNYAVYAGGGDQSTGLAYNNVYGYDPVGNTWTALTSMSAARMAHGQVTLSDGRILVTGGASAASGGSPLATCEAYTPSTNLWAGVASMNTARCDHTQVTLSDGRILVMGGRTLASGVLFYGTNLANTGPILQSCEIYDPVGNTWTAVGPMTYARFQHAAVVLSSGHVLVMGGVGYNPTQSTTAAKLATCEIFNPATGRWRPVGNLAYTRDWPAAAYLSDRNQVIVTGGSTSPTTEVFDTTKFTWSMAGSVYPYITGTGYIGTKLVQLANDLVVGFTGEEPQSVTFAGLIALYIPNADRVMSGGLNGQFAVATVPSPTSFTYLTEDNAYTLNASTTATVTPVAAAHSSIPGPYSYDPVHGVAVTSFESTTTQDVNQGHQYASLSVADATQFPDAPGWLALAFGYSNQVAPVKYLGRLSSTSLALDFSFKFPATVLSGAKVTLLSQKGAYVPEHPEQVGSFYLTASTAGRVAAEAAIDGAVGAGITVSKTVTYPGDRGLGNEGYPTSGQAKLSDQTSVWAGNDVDAEVAALREE